MDRRISILISICLFLVALGWFSRGLDFPPFYHPDEINKVIQIRKDYRNFNHPQLMLNTADILFRLGGKPESRTQTAALARWVSVIFAAATVGLLSWLAFLLAGPIAQLCCGWLLLSNPLLFELAHYLKEDPALAMGFALSYLCVLLYTRQPSAGRAAWVGFAAAIAISAKYIGVFPAVLGLAAMAWAGRAQPRHLAWALGTALLALAVINWQILVQLTQFRSGLGRELEIFAEKSSSLVNARNFNSVSVRLSFLVWLGFAIWLASPWIRRTRLGIGEYYILITSFGYAAMLVFSSRTAERYLLPLEISIPLILSVAACWLAAGLARPFAFPVRRLQLAVCLPVILLQAGGDIPGIRQLNAGFGSDARKALISFVRAELPPEAVLAEDYEVKLPDGTPRLETEGWNLPNQRVRSSPKARLGEEFSLSELREAGVTHVVLFADGKTRDLLAGKSRGAKSAKLGEFLQELDKNATLIWEKEGDKPAYLHPPLQLYRLDSGRAPTSSPTPDSAPGPLGP